MGVELRSMGTNIRAKYDMPTEAFVLGMVCRPTYGDILT